LKKGYRGYVSSRPFGEFAIPVPTQSLALRDYCARKNFLYVLPVNENSFPHSYLVLEGLIQDLSKFEGILMYSMHMLPERAQRRRGIYDKILDQGCSLHLVFEELVIGEATDIARVEEILVLARLANKNLSLAGIE
jgi:sporadic carbohydrate cluster protein (TIGR04323 family)